MVLVQKRSWFGQRGGLSAHCTQHAASKQLQPPRRPRAPPSSYYPVERCRSLLCGMASYEDPEVTALYTKVSLLVVLAPPARSNAYAIRLQLRNIEQYAKTIAQDKFNLEHRVRNLTRSLGFDSLRDAEESQSLRPHPLPASTSSDPPSPPPPALETYTRRIAELEEENARVRAEADSHLTKSSTLESDLARVSQELELTAQSLNEAQTRVTQLDKMNRKLKEDFDGRLNELAQSLHQPSSNAIELVARPRRAGISRAGAKENRKLVDVSCVHLFSLSLHRHESNLLVPSPVLPLYRNPSPSILLNSRLLKPITPRCSSSSTNSSKKNKASRQNSKAAPRNGGLSRLGYGPKLEV